MEEKIPRKIHFVWVGGGKKPEKVEKCIESWKVFCPDYEITEWNETNFDIESNPIVKEAIRQRNWALASDVIRLWAVYNYGGIYLDTDAEIIKPLDEFLQYEAFIGYENQIWLNPATFGAVKGHELFKKCLARYDDYSKIDFSTNALTVHTYGVMAKIIYNIKLKGKTQILDNGVAIFAEDYFCPQNYMTYKLKLTENSHVIHHYTSTWHSKSQRFWAAFARGSRKVLGRHIFKFFESIVAANYSSRIKREIKKAEKKRQNADENNAAINGGAVIADETASTDDSAN